MNIRFFCCFAILFFCFSVKTFGAPPNVTLPDDGTYTYWVQAKTGAVSSLPLTVARKKTFAVRKPVNVGDTLFVLDSHSGEIASKTLTPSAPVTLSVDDFHALTPPLPVPAAAMPSAAVPAKTAPAPRETFGSGLAKILTWLLGLIVFLAVVWLVRQIIQKRGEPLLALARKAGVELPEPTPLVEDKPMPVYSPPAAPSVERIPDEATAAAVVRPSVRRGPLMSLSGIPQLVGLEGLAAGSAFALTGKRTSVGRDGDNDIVLAENTVSRLHATLTRDRDAQITIADEGSANGIYVNGTRTERAILNGGDEVQIGDNVFRFEAGKD